MFRRLFRLLFLFHFLFSSGRDNCPKVLEVKRNRPATNASASASLLLWHPGNRSAVQGSAAVEGAASLPSETSNCSLVTGQYNAPRGDGLSKKGGGHGWRWVAVGCCEAQRLPNRLPHSYQVATVVSSNSLLVSHWYVWWIALNTFKLKRRSKRNELWELARRLPQGWRSPAGVVLGGGGGGAVGPRWNQCPI